MANNQTNGAQSNAVAKPVDTLKAIVNAPSVQDQFRNALGEHKDAFVASLIDLYTGDKSLQTCEPKLVIMEALRAATLKLPLNRALGFAYIVVYNNNRKVTDPRTGRDQWVKVPTPTFIPGYKGYIQLAMRTGQYKTINADVVYEGELKGFDKLSGHPDFSGTKTSDKVVGYFCHFALLNGFCKTLYMTVEEMAKYAKRYSPSVRRDTSVEQLIAKANDPSVSAKQVGWEGNFTDMAIKTVVRRLISKYGYLSVEMQNAVANDTADTPTASPRDEMLQEAQTEDVEVAEVVEVVDTETGEVQTPTEQEKPKTEAPETEGPDY